METHFNLSGGFEFTRIGIVAEDGRDVNWWCNIGGIIEVIVGVEGQSAGI